MKKFLIAGLMVTGPLAWSLKIENKWNEYFFR